MRRGEERGGEGRGEERERDQKSKGNGVLELQRESQRELKWQFWQTMYQHLYTLLTTLCVLYIMYIHPEDVVLLLPHALTNDTETYPTIAIYTHHSGNNCVLISKSCPSHLLLLWASTAGRWHRGTGPQTHSSHVVSSLSLLPSCTKIPNLY